MLKTALAGGFSRRIEMRPSKDANMQQLMVLANGGDPNDETQPGPSGVGPVDPTTKEMGRDNELVYDNSTGTGTVRNINDSDADGLPDTDTDNDGIADKPPTFYQPCVSIPVEGMSASEPPWGWLPREQELAVQPQEEFGSVAAVPKYLVSPAHPEGSYMSGGGPAAANPTSFNTPLDKSPELTRNGTTANYRTIHLQRLANPMLPWNPPPGEIKDAVGVDMHAPNLPVNPYRTIDSASTNLTAFNGTSNAEGVLDPTKKDKEGKQRPWFAGEATEYLNNMPDTVITDVRQVWFFRSLERGFWSRLNVVGAASNPVTSAPQRVLWRHRATNGAAKNSQGISVYI